MSEPLDLAIAEIQRLLVENEKLIAKRRALKATNRRLRDEISDRANVEADLRAQLAEEKAKTERLERLGEIRDRNYVRLVEAICDVADYLGISEDDDEGTLSIVLKISALVREVWPTPGPP